MSELEVTTLSNEFWVIKNGEAVVATVVKDDGRFKINYLPEPGEIKPIELTNPIFSENEPAEIQLSCFGYPTDVRPYNFTYNLLLRVPMYTKTKESKNMFCAGYYKIQKKNGCEVSFCPRLLFINSFPFAGPFGTWGEANDADI